MSIEFWAAAPRELKEEMVGFMNACYDNCEVPEIWRRRLVRALAKTEDAVGLEGIRPIALLEVGQKIMTGILTARLSEVWNKHETLHPSQMAFLFGRTSRQHGGMGGPN